MLTYEAVVTVLISEAERAGLAIQFSQEQLDPHSLARTLSISCQPTKQRDQHMEHVVATISFTWDAALTAISVMGSDAICALYHDSDEPCLHAIEGCAYNVDLDFDLTYAIPLTEEQRFNVVNIPQLTEAIQSATKEKTFDFQPLDIDVQLHFTGEYMAFVGTVTGRQSWPFGEALHEEHELRQEIRDLMQNVSKVLDALQQFQAPMPVLEDDAENEENELASLPDRTYLRPPTA